MTSPEDLPIPSQSLSPQQQEVIDELGDPVIRFTSESGVQEGTLTDALNRCEFLRGLPEEALKAVIEDVINDTDR